MGAFGATYTSVTNNENNLSTTAASAAAAVAASGTGYTWDNIGFQITRYDMPQSYYQAVASVLEGEAVFYLYYPNYSKFLGAAHALPKAG